jgi:hypothetical protein
MSARSLPPPELEAADMRTASPRAPHRPLSCSPRRLVSAVLGAALLSAACAGDTPVVPGVKPPASASTPAAPTSKPPAPTTTTPPAPTTTTPPAPGPKVAPSASAPPFPPPPAPVGEHGPRPLPTSVQGYAACKHPGCSDAARACDDYIRSGCSAGSWPYDGQPPNGPTANPSFQKAVAACAEWSVGQLGEWLERPADGSIPEPEKEEGPDAEDAKRRWRLRLLSTCTRNAASCGEMGLCFSGRHVLAKRPTTAPPPFPAVAPVLPPPPLPWTLPLADPGPDPLSSATAWGAPAELMPVDSPSCVACASDRCPTIAYKCFGAADVAADCPGGDCCHAFRRCVRDCGAYAPGTGTSKFDDCVYECAVGRDHAVQELADLQQCGDVPCNGCETRDAPVLP